MKLSFAIRAVVLATPLALLTACGGGGGEGFEMTAKAVTIDWGSGTGFIGKGDVQNAFEWNNATFQTNAGAVTFYATREGDVSYTCVWTTGPDHNRTTHRVTRKVAEAEGGSTLEFSRHTRLNPQGEVTGYTVTFGAWTETGTSRNAPEVGDPCPGNQGTGAVVESVDDGESFYIAVYAKFGVDSRLIHRETAE